MYNSIGVALIRRLSEYMQLVIKAGSCVCVYVHGMMHVCFVTHTHTHSYFWNYMDVQPACYATTSWSSFHEHQLMPATRHGRKIPNSQHSTVLKTWAIGCMWTVAFEQGKNLLGRKKNPCPKKGNFSTLKFALNSCHFLPDPLEANKQTMRSSEGCSHHCNCIDVVWLCVRTTWVNIHLHSSTTHRISYAVINHKKWLEMVFPNFWGVAWSVLHIHVTSHWLTVWSVSCGARAPDMPLCL